MRVSSPTLVGRDEEMVRMAAAYERARQGEPQTVIVQGDAGVGKSRLVGEFVAEVRNAGDVAIVGRCADVEGGLPFGPVVEGFRDLMVQRESPELTPHFSLLRPILPEVEDPKPQGRSPSRTALFQGMARVLGAVARPVVFVIEDAHWSERSTRDVVRFLVNRLVDETIMLIVTIRSDEPAPAPELHGWLGELKRTPSVSVVDVRPLDREEARRQIEEITGKRPTVEVVESIYKRSQGNPFFIEELIAAGVDTRAPLLPTLADAFRARVASLDEDGRDLLRAVAVSDLGVTHDALVEALSSEPLSIARALREAVAAHLLVKQRDDRYAFRHALLKELLYDELTPHERRHYHRVFATALSASADDRDSGVLSQIAHHWWEAAESARAREAFITAADAAEAALAHREAMEHLVAAAELSEVLGEEDPLVDALYERAARAAGLAGDWDDVDELLKRALDRVDRSQDPERAAYLMWRIAWTRWWVLRDPALSLLEEALDLIPRQPPSGLRSRLLRMYAYVAEFTGEGIDHLDDLNAGAVSTARLAGDTLEEALSRVQAGTVLTPRMSPEMGPVLEALDEVKHQGTPDDILDASVKVGDALTYLGDFELALSVTREALALATELGIHASWPGLILQFENGLYYLGRWDEAEGLEHLFEDVRTVRTPQAMFHLSGCPIWIGRGRFDKVRETFDLVAATVAESSTNDRAAMAAMAGHYYLWTGDLARASREVRVGIEEIETHPTLPNAQELFLIGLQVEAARILSGETGTDAERLADEYIQGARRAAREGQDRISPMILEWSEAEFARAQGRNDPKLWENVVAGWEQVGVPWFEAWTRWRHAEALLAAGAARSAAVEPLHRAHEIASRLGAAPLLSELERLARRARIPLASIQEQSETDEPSGADSPVERFRLTARELEVLGLIAAGKTNPEIAAELFISVKTASAHVSHILAKLGVARRGEAAFIAHSMNLPAGDAAHKQIGHPAAHI